MNRATECSTIPAKVIASSFALVAFAAALFVGLQVGNPVTTVIYRATLVMLMCWPVGYAIGRIGQRVVDHNIETYKAQHPIPADMPPDTDQDQAAQDASPRTGSTTEQIA